MEILNEYLGKKYNYYAIKEPSPNLLEQITLMLYVRYVGLLYILTS